MHNIIVYGPGCANCTNTAKVITEVLTELNVPFNLTKVTDYQQMAQDGIMSTPTVKIDGQIMPKKSKIPTIEEVKGWVNR